jgi:hypothetical protein
MTFVPIMWSVWGVFVALMLSLHIYRGSLEKNEDDQIFLDDSFEHEKAAQMAIVAKVHKGGARVRVAKWLALGHDHRHHRLLHSRHPYATRCNALRKSGRKHFETVAHCAQFSRPRR